MEIQKSKNEKRPKLPLIADVFAGVGGLSLGAARAGFEVRSVVEWDPIAIGVHESNFPESIHIRRDVATLSGEQLLSLSKLRYGELDGLIGGPGS